MAKTPHGNSKDSEKPQHLYEIKDHDLPVEDDTFKYGVSGTPLKEDGSSERANKQVNKLNKKSGWQRFFAKILRMGIEGRAKVLGLETDAARKYKETHKNRLPPGMNRPNPQE